MGEREAPARPLVALSLSSETMRLPRRVARAEHAFTERSGNKLSETEHGSSRTRAIISGSNN